MRPLQATTRTAVYCQALFLALRYLKGRYKPVQVNSLSHTHTAEVSAAVHETHRPPSVCVCVQTKSMIVVVESLTRAPVLTLLLYTFQL